MRDRAAVGNVDWIKSSAFSWRNYRAWGSLTGGVGVSCPVRGSGCLVKLGSMAHLMSSSRKEPPFHALRAGEGLWPGPGEAFYFLASRGSKTKAD